MADIADTPGPVSVAAWNVNSVRSRLPHLLAWLKRDHPDIVLLQELKCVEDAFPFLEIEELGYNAAVYAEKTYNGVAILSCFPLDDVCKGLPGDAEDTQARYIEAVASLPGAALRVASVYVPNGQSVDSDKFLYKLRFLERLYGHLKGLLAFEEATVIGGDYNVAPYPCDIYDPKRLDGTVCYHPEERARLRAIFHLGYMDAFRLRHPLSWVDTHKPSGEYTFWDYRAHCFTGNLGYRIDHLLLSPQAADMTEGCDVLKEWRAVDKASDHAPVIARLRPATLVPR